MKGNHAESGVFLLVFRGYTWHGSGHENVKHYSKTYVEKLPYHRLAKHKPKKKANTFIHVAGLGIGMAASILILIWVQFEWSVDRFHKKTPIGCMPSGEMRKCKENDLPGTIHLPPTPLP